MVLLALLVYGLLFALPLVGWLFYAAHQTSVLGYAYRYDFLSMFIGARAVVVGHGLHLYDLALQRTLSALAIAPFQRPWLLPFVYPAYDAVLLAPVGWLSYGTAFLVWGAANLVCAGVLLKRLLGAVAISSAGRTALFLASAGFLPLLLTLLQGQFGMLPALGLAGAALSVGVGQDRRAGFWLLLGLIKPQLILLPVLALALDRRPRALLVFAAGASGALGLSFIFAGVWLPSYARILQDMTQQGAELGDYPGAMQNWRGLWTVLLGDGPLPTLLLAVSVVLSVGLVMALYWPAGGLARIPRDARFALTILLGILIVPHLYLHDLVAALPAGFLLWRCADRVHVLRWLLALGPPVMIAAQFAQLPHIQFGPWYLVLLVVTALLYRQKLSPAALKANGPVIEAAQMVGGTERSHQYMWMIALLPLHAQT